MLCPGTIMKQMQETQTLYMNKSKNVSKNVPRTK